MTDPNDYKLKNAIISVSDKAGIVEFCKELVSLGIELYSTGGTSRLLKENSIPVKSVSELTDFPEILDGRVKTLHPGVHSGLLAKLDNADHLEQLDKHNLKSIDLLVVNLYPFEATLERTDDHKELIENIDIGGPAMLRASAKNYKWTAPIVNPDKYSEIIEIMKNGNNTIPLEYRAKLACEVFSHTAYYDSLIAKYLQDFTETEIPKNFAVPMKLQQTLRYGENPHQKAALYGNFSKMFEQVHGKELSYNNILDIDACSKVILEFSEPAVSIVKHTNPCGVGVASNIKEAYLKAFETDTVSPFGGIIAMNRICDIEAAETIHPIFTEVLIAPSFSDEALELLRKKKDRRLIVADFDVLRKHLIYELRSVAGAYLYQDCDTKQITESDLKIVSKRQPSEEELKAMLFGWKIVKNVKSNAIVYSRGDRTLAVGCGQMSRVDSARIAAEKAKMMNLSLVGCAVASDAFFPFADGMLEAASVGATAVIQPGGSVRDEEVIAAANEHNITMAFTSIRHFKH